MTGRKRVGAGLVIAWLGCWLGFLIELVVRKDLSGALLLALGGIFFGVIIVVRTGGFQRLP